jgi:hypothetical protein
LAVDRGYHRSMAKVTITIETTTEEMLEPLKRAVGDVVDRLDEAMHDERFNGALSDLYAKLAAKFRRRVDGEHIHVVPDPEDGAS